jgi:hypothetical protein
MRNISPPLPRQLEELDQSGLLAASERLESLRVHNYPEDDQRKFRERFATMAKTVEALDKDDNLLERLGLGSDDWSFAWGTRFTSDDGDRLELRSFISHRGDRTSVFRSYEHVVIEFNDASVMALRLGYDHRERRPLLIAVKKFNGGPWTRLLSALVVAAESKAK